MTTVSSGAADQAIVLRRAEARVHFERHIVSIRAPSPRRDFRQNELDLIKQARVNRSVAWPGALVVLRQEICQTEVR